MVFVTPNLYVISHNWRVLFWRISNFTAFCQWVVYSYQNVVYCFFNEDKCTIFWSKILNLSFWIPLLYFGIFSAPFPLLSPATLISINKNIEYHQNSRKNILEACQSRRMNWAMNKWKILTHCLTLLRARLCTPRLWGCCKSVRMNVKLGSFCCYLIRSAC